MVRSWVFLRDFSVGIGYLLIPKPNLCPLCHSTQTRIFVLSLIFIFRIFIFGYGLIPNLDDV